MIFHPTRFESFDVDTNSRYVMDYFPHSGAEERKLKNEMEFIVKAIAQYYPNFAISSTSWGVTSDIAIPVINIILPPSSDRSIAMGVFETLNPFAFDVFPVRVGTGVVVAAGKIHYYPYTPVGASISHDEIYDGKYPTAGTLGCYLKLKDGRRFREVHT
jgi:hypothetical protein